MHCGVTPRSAGGAAHSQRRRKHTRIARRAIGGLRPGGTTRKHTRIAHSFARLAPLAYAQLHLVVKLAEWALCAAALPLGAESPLRASAAADGCAAAAGAEASRWAGLCIGRGPRAFAAIYPSSTEPRAPAIRAATGPVATPRAQPRTQLGGSTARAVLARAAQLAHDVCWAVGVFPRWA